MNRFLFKTIKSFIYGLIILGIIFIQIPLAKAAYSAGTIVSLTNSARASNGLGALATNSELASAAYAKANDILNKDYFAHNSPDGRTPWDFINESGYTYAYAGENLAIGYSDASELFNAWMNSQTHRDNILNSNFREIGVAVVSGDFEGQEAIVAVQEFGAANSQDTSENTAQVASENITTGNPDTQPSATPSITPSAQVGFNFIKEKSELSPESIFSGEEATFKVTLTGEVKSLEVQVFDQKFNLLDTASASDNQGKTFTLKNKIENVGSSEVKVVGKDSNGNSQTLSLGTLEVKTNLITKADTKENSGLIAGFSAHFKTNWIVYTIVLITILGAVAFYFITRYKNKFNTMLTSWRF